MATGILGNEWRSAHVFCTRVHRVSRPTVVRWCAQAIWALPIRMRPTAVERIGRETKGDWHNTFLFAKYCSRYSPMLRIWEWWSSWKLRNGDALFQSMVLRHRQYTTRSFRIQAFILVWDGRGRVRKLRTLEWNHVIILPLFPEVFV